MKIIVMIGLELLQNPAFCGSVARESERRDYVTMKLTLCRLNRGRAILEI